MFSYGESNSYPLSYNYHSPSLLYQNHNKNLIFGSYNQLPCLPNSPPILENSINTLNNVVIPLHSSTSKLLLEASMNDQGNSLVCPSTHLISQMSSKRSSPNVKKARYTKITTAQGERDRRVRLSIHIAREFFKLQDMLGFDKASRTLGWLLAKSRTAIDELANEKVSETSIIEPEDSIKEDDEMLKTSKKLKRGRKYKGKGKGDQFDEKEVRREKARERARERTKNKMMMMMIFNLNDHQRDQNNLMISQSNQGIDVGDESLVIKEKLRGLCHNYNYEMNTKDNYDQEGLQL